MKTSYEITMCASGELKEKRDTALIFREATIILINNAYGT